ncbi:MAG TPA: HAD family phosphatase [Bryobacteraceae bacterium]|nr:HAD family phosphatase [Bryobacteraceae bacterium]
MITALIFDLDGVIIDSMPLHTEAWRVYLLRLGIASTDSDIAGRMHGRRNDDIVAEFISGDLAPAEIFEHGAAKERLYRELMQSQLQRYLVPGIAEFLDRWRALPLGVASNAEPANVDLVLDGLGLRARFRVIVNGHQVDRPKPFPDVYLRAADLLGVRPRDCVVFEDSPTGVQAALAAGMTVVGVQTHSADLESVDLAIRDFQDPKLEPWLRSRVAKTNESD